MDAAVTIVMLVPVLLAVALIVGIIRRNLVESHAGGPAGISRAIPAIIVLMVAVLVISSLPSSEQAEPDFELYDCIPLSSFGSEVSVSGRCAEIAIIGGESYVRMKDLGTFSVTADGTETLYSVGKAHMDLVVWAGQSNSMTYTNPSFYDGPATLPPGKGFYFGQVEPVSDVLGGIVTEATVDDAAVCDILGDDGSMRIAQMYPSFYGDYYAETSHRLMTVSTGIGGMSIAVWDDGDRGDALIDVALSKLKEECEGRIELTPVAVLWVQGETNANSSVAYYLEHFRPLLEKLEDGHYSGFEFPYITSSLPRANMRPIDNMINPALAQIEEAEQDPQFSIATCLAYRAPADLIKDGVHFTQTYYNWAGEAFARQVAILTGHQPVPETIVLAETVGTVDSLPSTVEAYGTTGEAYQLAVEWTETSAGVYSGSLAGNPSGTRILPGLVVQATLGD